MLVYIEKSLKDNKILKKLNFNNKIYIKNYKNIFDKSFPNGNKEKIIVFANLSGNSLTKTPLNYGHEKLAYFLKTSLNCVFDCRYCFLKGAFKNDFPVFFLNYDDMKKDIKVSLNDFDKPYPLWFYSSDYSDNFAMNGFSKFIQEFVPFFEELDGAMMEIRTKSSNIKSLLDLGFVPQNTEIAFSLNPQEIIEKYEIGTASLDERINAINILIEKSYKVGLRFLPLLPVKDYKKIYKKFVCYISEKIDISRIYSSFASGLLYTKGDYNTILKKDPHFDLLYYLEENQDGFFREKKEIRKYFYDLFTKLDKNCKICLDDVK